MMYSENDLTAICEQQKRRWLIIAIPCVLLFITMIIALVMRSPRNENDLLIRIIADVCTIGIGILLIGGWTMFIKPLHCYEKHLRGLLQGRTHVFDEGTFAHMDSDISLVDGVEYYAIYLNTLDDKKKPYERLFYYDAQKERPSFEEGQRVHVVYHDKQIGLIEAL